MSPKRLSRAVKPSGMWSVVHRSDVQDTRLAFEEMHGQVTSLLRL